MNTLIENVKKAITSIYHTIRSQHAPHYPAEFEHRFN
ncbi:MAG: transposase [Sodalis sp. (in: enterobacteria)]